MKDRKVSSIKGENLFRACILAAAFLCLFGKSLDAYAEGNRNIAGGEKTEVIFLLDTSLSMNKQDKDRGAIDAIKQAAYSFPANYEVGFVAYNTGIQSIVPLTSEAGVLDTALEAVEYRGYTNAGEGLDEALSLFTEDKNVRRYIIMISDGEIDMPNKQDKEQSREVYVKAARRAKEKEIQILIGAIGTEIKEDMHIFDGAELTGGAIYWEGQQDSAAQVIGRMIEDRLSFPCRSIGIIDTGGGNVHAELPQGVKRVKIIVTAGAGLNEITADYSAESGRTITGTNYAVVDMLRPSSDYIDIHLSLFKQ